MSKEWITKVSVFCGVAWMKKVVNQMSGGQEMVNVFIMHAAIIKISINIIAVISWLPSLISELFHPGFAVLHGFHLNTPWPLVSTQFLLI